MPITAALYFPPSSHRTFSRPSKRALCKHGSGAVQAHIMLPCVSTNLCVVWLQVATPSQCQRTWESSSRRTVASRPSTCRYTTTTLRVSLGRRTPQGSRRMPPPRPGRRSAQLAQTLLKTYSTEFSRTLAFHNLLSVYRVFGCPLAAQYPLC